MCHEFFVTDVRVISCQQNVFWLNASMWAKAVLCGVVYAFDFRHRKKVTYTYSNNFFVTDCK